jgi:hypothetical protein
VFRKRRKSAESDAPVYDDLRGMVLQLDPGEAGLTPTAALPRAYGVVMDTVYSSGAATLVALADGTTSLYLSSGGGTIGAGQHESVAAASRRLVAMAEEAVDGIPSVTDDPMPPPGATTIRVLTYGGPHAVTAPEDDFGNGRHELSSLFHGAHAVITEIRLLNEARGD